jgi:glycosyltransferase involved in cell wall biosynthesis
MSNEMHTAHIIQRAAPGGIETLVLRLAASLPGKHSIISLEGKADELQAAWPALKASTAQLVCLEKRDGLQPRTVFKLARTLRKLQANVLFTHHLGPMLYGSFAHKLSPICKRHIHVEHDGWHFEDLKYPKLWQRIYKLSKPQMVSISQQLGCKLQNLSLAKDPNIILNGVALDEFRPRPRLASRKSYDLPEDAFIVGAVGRLERVKGFDLLIDALGSLPSSTHVVIAGAGSQEQALRHRAIAFSLEQRVHFLGHQENISSLMPAFDVLAVPSRDEGLPLTVLEAQACGVPVVGADVGAMQEALCPLSGTLIAPENARALARALMRHALTQPLQKSHRQAARLHVEERFNWGKTVTAYQDLMKGAA